MTQNDPDVIVVGGGLAGLSLTALLAQKGVSVACIDRENPPSTLEKRFDGRTTAVSWASQKVLAAAGIWDAISGKACAIQDIQILDDGSPVLLEFLTQDVGAEAFGWILENRHLRAALYDVIQKSNHATHIAPQQVKDFSLHETHASVHLADDTVISAPLIIGADGRGSFTREWMGIKTRQWPYNQRAIVCIANHENPHNNIAIEHFHPEGPFAVLPMLDDDQGRHRSSVVWTEHGPEQKSAMRYNQESFDAALSARFPESFGAAWQIGERFSYPLGLIHAHSYIAPRMALVAEAAHGIHPIAGQGLNMGFRDIAAITDLISQAKESGDDIGSEELLQTYQRTRRADNMAMAAATDCLNKLFANRLPPIRLARQIGLKAVQRLRPAKHFFMHQAMGQGFKKKIGK